MVADGRLDEAENALASCGRRLGCRGFHIIRMKSSCIKAPPREGHRVLRVPLGLRIAGL